MKFKDILFQKNKILFGENDAQFITAVEFDEERDDIEVYFRRDGKTYSERQRFHPFLLLSDLKYLDKWKGEYEDIELSGDECFRYLILMKDWNGLKGLVKFLQRTTKFSPRSFNAPFYYLNDPVNQHLLFTGQTLFKGMTFDDLVRLQIDIETYCKEGFEFSNPLREEDRIIVISMSDNRGWEKVISGRKLSEGEMIEEMLDEIDNRDPDMIEGHNIFNFDLSYIQTRAGGLDIPLIMGRGKRLLTSHSSRLNIAERTISYKKFNVYGRHIVDTWILAQLYDVSMRDLESYGLKNVARHFNLATEERVYINPDRINWYYDNEPDTLFDYALDDVRETGAVSRLLSQSFFYQAQIFPYSFQNIIVRGNATKIDSLFLREYIRERHSIPSTPQGREYSGGYTDILSQGIMERVLYCDVQSLYPSIMLTFKYLPKRDHLKIFASLLNDLKEFRFQAKGMKDSAKTRVEKDYFDALQNTFKILINSFYGYLGFNYGHFSDFDEAGNVTRKGRELIRFMIDWLQENSCKVIEIDTDGIYFLPPDNISDEKEEKALIKRLSDRLPEGINLELAGRYRAIFSYKIKNYALLDYNNQLIIKGSGLRSRGLELFQRRFMKEMFMLMLTKKEGEIPSLLKRYIEDLTEHRWDKKMFVKTETIQEPIAKYNEKIRNKKRNPSAAYELAKMSDRNYQAGDQISYYVTGTEKKVRVFDNCRLASLWNPDNPDENVEYYKKKLIVLYGKFKEFINEREGDQV
ncbi:MAG: DNA polymerase domain-containing protein [Nitrospirota bacterium]